MYQRIAEHEEEQFDGFQFALLAQNGGASLRPLRSAEARNSYEKLLRRLQDDVVHAQVYQAAPRIPIGLRTVDLTAEEAAELERRLESPTTFEGIVFRRARRAD